MSEKEHETTLPASARVIFYHKTPTSGKTCFLKQESGDICCFEKLPKLSQIVEQGDKGYENDVTTHPAILLQHASTKWGFAAEEMEIDSVYHEKVDIAGDCLSVYLARFTTVDPPFESAQNIGASFISITEARNLSPVELELLRRAYTVIMEG
jgi:hypothetical protein